MLDAWLGWARRCQIPAIVELYHRIKKHRAGIVAAVTLGLSNGLTESVNTKLRLITRMACGFRSTDNLIALCLLDRGGHCPPLPAGDDPRIGSESHITTGAAGQPSRRRRSDADGPVATGRSADSVICSPGASTGRCPRTRGETGRCG